MKSNTSTSEFILKTVSPIFNKQGYVGTSISHLTKATGLTKRVIYCNFTNKEDLAVKAFGIPTFIATVKTAHKLIYLNYE